MWDLTRPPEGKERTPSSLSPKAPLLRMHVGPRLGASTGQAPQSIPEGPLTLPSRSGSTSGAPSGRAPRAGPPPRPEQRAPPRGGQDRPGGWVVWRPAAPSHGRQKLARHVGCGGWGCFPPSQGQDPRRVSLRYCRPAARGGDDFKAAEPSAGGTVGLGARAPPAGPLRGLHPGWGWGWGTWGRQ